MVVNRRRRCCFVVVAGGGVASTVLLLLLLCYRFCRSYQYFRTVVVKITASITPLLTIHIDSKLSKEKH